MSKFRLKLIKEEFIKIVTKRNDFMVEVLDGLPFVTLFHLGSLCMRYMKRKTERRRVEGEEFPVSLTSFTYAISSFSVLFVPVISSNTVGG